MSKSADKKQKRKADAESTAVVAPPAEDASAKSGKSDKKKEKKAKRKAEEDEVAAAVDDNAELKKSKKKKDEKKKDKKGEKEEVGGEERASKKARKEESKKESKSKGNGKGNGMKQTQADGGDTGGEAPSGVPSFLAGAKFDAELDALFAAAPPPPPRPAPEVAAAAAPTSASKAQDDEDDDEEEDEGDETVYISADEDDADGEEEKERGEDERDDEELSSLASDEFDALYDDEDEEEEDAEMEEADTGAEQSAAAEDDEDDVDGDEEDDEEADDDDDDEDEDEDDSQAELVHETLRTPSSHAQDKLSARRQREGDDEPSEVLDRRTIFIGNVVIDAVKSKPLQKALRRHIESFSPVPGLVKTSAIRFRSVPFSVPTDSLDREGAGSLKDKKQRERGQLYKEATRQLDNEEGKAQGKVFLNAKQKRKVAYINQELNTHAVSVNAYVRIQPPDVDLVKRTWDGAEHAGVDFSTSVNAPILAALIAVSANGSVFEGRHLRTDVVSPMEPADIVAAGLDKLKSPLDRTLLVVGNTHTSSGIDSKRTVFVGNMDFQAEEEEVRGFFEKLLREERGRPPARRQVKIVTAAAAAANAVAGASASSKPSSSKRKVSGAGPVSRSPLLFGAVTEEAEGEWVQDVRLVRDRATQMGKGFGYVRFVDTACVEEVLALHEAEDAYIQALKSGRAAKAPPVSSAKKADKAKSKKEGVKDSWEDESDGDGELLSGAAKDTYRRKFKFKSRALRVTRCKNTTQRASVAAPSSSSVGGKHSGGRDFQSRRDGSSSSSSSFDKNRRGAPPHISRNGGSRASTGASAARAPRPNAAIAAPQFASLSKEERAAIKRADPGRNARRMEKKLSKKRTGSDGDVDGGAGNGPNSNKARVKLAQGKSLTKRKPGVMKAGRLPTGATTKRTKSSTAARVRKG
ncbi:Nucleolar protein 12 [Tilletia horrida]|nr:Nucleolar protein 12 [Tilletia horrida]